MRRVRLLPRPDRPSEVLHPSELGKERPNDAIWEAMIQLRHRYEDEWYEALIGESGLEGKRMTASRVRTLLLMALQRYREETV